MGLGQGVPDAGTAAISGGMADGPQEGAAGRTGRPVREAGDRGQSGGRGAPREAVGTLSDGGLQGGGLRPAQARRGGRTSSDEGKAFPSDLCFHTKKHEKRL